MPRCPVCFVPMTRIEEEGVRAHTCPSCFGHWIASVALLRRVRMDVEKAVAAAAVAEAPAETPAAAAEDDGQTSLADMAAVVAEADSKKPLRCAECEKFMLKDRYQQMIPIIVDRCKHCDRIWLDTGEYNLIRRLYVELNTSTDPKIVQLREKVAMTTLEWDHRQTLSQSVGKKATAAGTLADITLNVLFNMLG